MLDRSIRDIERERQNLQNQEKKLIVEIKKTAKQNQMVGAYLLLSPFSKLDVWWILTALLT